MRRAIVPGVFLLLAVAIHLSAAPASCREYVVTLSRNINIRTGPDTEHVIVGRAWKGVVFDLAGETGNWWKIYMFSGEPRYISKSWAARLTEEDICPGHNMALPTDALSRRGLHQDILSARARARGEAEELVSASIDAERNGNLEKVLEDRFVLEVFSIHSAQPALYEELSDVAYEGRW